MCGIVQLHSRQLKLVSESRAKMATAELLRLLGGGGSR